MATSGQLDCFIPLSVRSRPKSRPLEWDLSQHMLHVPSSRSSALPDFLPTIVNFSARSSSLLVLTSGWPRGTWRFTRFAVLGSGLAIPLQSALARVLERWVLVWEVGSSRDAKCRL
jgi:hypothetical protein